MANILKALLFLFTTLGCKAQTITPLYWGENTPDDGIQASRYYKDVDNDYDPYVGTWSGTLGNGSLTMTFNKIVNNYDGGQTYSDLLVGEYRYMENGGQLVDTYPSIYGTDANGVPIIAKPDPWKNTIVSENIKSGDWGFCPPCPECPQGTRFVILGIADPTRPNVDGKMVMARFIEAGVEKIRIRIFATYAYNYTGSGPTYLTIPENSIWTLVKVQ